MSPFWAFLHFVWVIAQTHTCEAVTQSTHSTPLKEAPVLYGGNCVQAFQLALLSKGSIAWIVLP